LYVLEEVRFTAREISSQQEATCLCGIPLQFGERILEKSAFYSPSWEPLLLSLTTSEGEEVTSPYRVRSGADRST
jgi:hypothetical protein